VRRLKPIDQFARRKTVVGIMHGESGAVQLQADARTGEIDVHGERIGDEAQQHQITGELQPFLHNHHMQAAQPNDELGESRQVVHTLGRLLNIRYPIVKSTVA
jgi:hypothetical protein